MTKDLLEESLKGLDRAKDALNAARHDLKGGYELAAVNRAYYSIFYCANALLHIKNINVKSHQGVRTKFSEEYIKTGLLPLAFAEKMRNAYSLREEADYDLDASISIQEAQTTIQDAEDILSASELFLKNLESDFRAQDS